MTLRWQGIRGFTLFELLVTMTLIVIMAGIAVPLMTNASASMKLGDQTRQVERELQTARSTAVTANQPVRFRFDCPATGQFRVVELVGTPSIPASADDAANRCGLATYPYPASDTNPLTRPNHDGPLRELDSSVTFSTAQTIEFWPDGTAHMNTGGSNPWPVIASPGYSIVLIRNSKTKSILVNGSGKIQVQ